MFFWLIHHLQFNWHVLRVFNYLTFRSIVSALTSFTISLYFCPKLIQYFQAKQVGQYVRDCGPKTHLAKSGTPTMGGLLILCSILMSMVLWGDLTNPYLLMALFTMIGFGVIGGVDDFRKISQKNTEGLSARKKLF